MPMAELLGVQFDMQLLLKLSASVAAVLLVSWAYRFYSSRNAKLCAKDKTDQQSAACQNCKTTLEREGPPPHDTDDGGQQVKPAAADSDADDWTPPKRPVQDISLGGEAPTRQNQTEFTGRSVSSGSALSPPGATESGAASASGRRSPCFLQKLEGCVGVGRELRQDLERQGAYSSFLSKAEIKVEDASVVLEGTGDQVVRGKIYDYYVESNSNSELQPVEFGSRCSSLSESPSSLSPIVMRDLVLPQSTAKGLSSTGSHKSSPPTRPVLLRKESYLSAAEQCELSVPFDTPAASEPANHSLAPTGSEPLPVHPAIRPRADSRQAPLDLGNCLETLYLAKKHGQTSVQQEALEVMSDNYLQVLRDPNIYGRLMAGEREQIQRQRTGGRRFVTVADMDPQDWTKNTGETAETDQRRTSSAMYYYDDYKDSWQTLCLIPQEVVSKACAMCTMDNYLFVAVGCQCTDGEMTPSKRVFCYNPLTSIWTEISPMNEARPRCKLAALDGCIYAIGGECHSSVERYDPRLDRWTFVAPLPNDTFAVAHHVTVCNGEIFVSGGTLRYMLLRYSPKSNTWRPSLLVGNKDRMADMVAVGRFLYRFDVNPLLGVSVYRYHTVARLWYECSSKRLLRCPAFQCVTMDGTVYCVSRQFTMRFNADEVSPAFTDEDLNVLSAAKGLLFPFVLSLPDKIPRQTSV